MCLPTELRPRTPLMCTWADTTPDAGSFVWRRMYTRRYVFPKGLPRTGKVWLPSFGRVDSPYANHAIDPAQANPDCISAGDAHDPPRPIRRGDRGRRKSHQQERKGGGEQGTNHHEKNLRVQAVAGKQFFSA